MFDDATTTEFVADLDSSDVIAVASRCREPATVVPPSFVHDDAVFELTPKPLPIPESREEASVKSREEEADEAVSVAFAAKSEAAVVTGELMAVSEASLSSDVIEVIPISGQGDGDAIEVAPRSAASAEEEDVEEVESSAIELLPESFAAEVASAAEVTHAKSESTRYSFVARARLEEDREVTEALAASAKELESVRSADFIVSTARGAEISQAIEALAATSRVMDENETPDVFAVKDYNPASLAVLDLGAESGRSLLTPPTLRAFIASYPDLPKAPAVITESIPPVVQTTTKTNTRRSKTAVQPAGRKPFGIGVRGAMTGSALLLAAATALVAVRGGNRTPRETILPPPMFAKIAATQPASPVGNPAAAALDVAPKSASIEVQPAKHDVPRHASSLRLTPAQRAAVEPTPIVPTMPTMPTMPTIPVEALPTVNPAPVAAETTPAPPESAPAQLAVAPIAPEAAPVEASGASLDDAIAQAVVKDDASRKRTATPPAPAAPAKKEPPATDAEVVSAKADRAYSSGDLTRAAALYRQALAISPRFIPARLGAAAVEWDSGNRDSARDLYRTLVSDAPGFVPAIARERAQ